MIPQLYDCFKHWSSNGTVWLYSDTHFNDADCKIMDPNWITPEEQIRRINAKVGKKDTLIILGDIGDISYISKLRGYKVLICGNHDAGASNYKRIHTSGFYIDESEIAEQHDYEIKDWWKVKYNLPTTQYPFEKPNVKGYELDNNLFDEVYTGPLMIGEKILLSHEPIENCDWALNIHGHTHALKKNMPNHLCVCSNVIGYEPISLNKIIKEGGLSKVQSLHRETIDEATERKKKKCGSRKH